MPTIVDPSSHNPNLTRAPPLGWATRLRVLVVGSVIRSMKCVAPVVGLMPDSGFLALLDCRWVVGNWILGPVDVS